MSEKLYPIKLYIRYPSVFIMLVVSVVVNLSTWIWLGVRLDTAGEDLIFLHYNILFGVDLIGVWWKVYYVPFVGSIIIIINFLLGWILFNKDKFVASLLMFASTVSQVFLLIGALLLVFLNV